MMVYMETTTERDCVYCNGAGNVWGGSVYAPRRRCLICNGTGRLECLPEGDESATV